MQKHFFLNVIIKGKGIFSFNWKIGHPLLDAGDLKILIGLFLCEYEAHAQKEREGIEKEKLRQRVIKNRVPF